MTLISPEYFWLFLFLVAAFMKKDFSRLRLTSYGYILTFIFIVFALVRPVIEQEPIQTREVLNDVVVAVDLSYSMQARDIAPSRLEFAKNRLNELVKKEKKSRFGVLGFTTNAIILSPLTADSELLLHLFNSLDEKLIMTRGSSIMPALRLARKMSKSKKLSVVILSDGADALNYSDEVAFAKENNLIVNVLMVATNIGSTLPLENGELLKDELGDIVVSRKNSAIEAISNATDGVYSSDFDDILDALTRQRENEFVSNTRIVKNLELFYYFVGLAILSFLVSVTSLKRYVLAFLLLFGVSLQADVLNIFADKNRVAFQEAEKFYKSGEYDKALLKYESIKSSSPEVKSVVFYNEGNTLVRLKEFEKAREAYKKSLTLLHTKEAYENMIYIMNVKEQEQMSSGQQKSAQKSSIAKKRDSTQKKKEGGSSNMKVSAVASSGSEDKGKKSKSDSKVDLNLGKAKLSSTQYELINARRVDEKKPW